MFVNHSLKAAYRLVSAEQATEVEMEAKAVVDEVSRIVTSMLDIHGVYQRFGEALSKLVDCDRIAIFVLGRKKGLWSPNTSSG